MPDYSIALGVKPIQLESPLNQMAKAYEMQNAVQSNKLNQMKMDEYERGLASNQEIKNYLANTSPDNPNYITGAYAIDPEFGMKLGENIAKIDKEKALTKASKVETLAKTYNIYKSTVGGIIGMPTQANAIAKIRRAGELLDMDTTDDEAEVMALGEDPAKITQWASSLSLEADKLLPKPTERATNTYKELTDTNPASPTYGQVIPGSRIEMGISPEAQLSANTQRRGQDITARGQDLTNRRELEKIAIEKGRNSPEYIKAEAKAKEQGKQAAIFEATAPQAILKAEEAIRKIDELIGDTTIDNKGKLQYGKVKPHPGFSVSIGASAQPGFQYLSGSDKANFYARIEEIQGQAFMQAFETLKGGGAITETEGIKGTKAITRMSTAQSEPEFIRAATEFKSIVRKGLENAKSKLAPTTGDVDANNPLLN